MMVFKNSCLLITCSEIQRESVTPFTERFSPADSLRIECATHNLNGRETTDYLKHSSWLNPNGFMWWRTMDFLACSYDENTETVLRTNYEMFVNTCSLDLMALAHALQI